MSPSGQFFFLKASLNQRVLHEIYSFRINENYTVTVLKFSDGHIYVHWIILEAHGAIWWTLARDTNSDNIVKVILPEVSLAEGLVFVEEVYSSIQSLILNPNSRDLTVQNTDIHPSINQSINQSCIFPYSHPRCLQKNGQEIFK